MLSSSSKVIGRLQHGQLKRFDLQSLRDILLACELRGAQFCLANHSSFFLHPVPHRPRMFRTMSWHFIYAYTDVRNPTFEVSIANHVTGIQFVWTASEGILRSPQLVYALIFIKRDVIREDYY